MSPPPQPRDSNTSTTTKMMSLQLPDILSACSIFELRTNKHCRPISLASEKWLLDVGVSLSSSNNWINTRNDVPMSWSAVKPGLLAAACYPSADATQVRFVADFLGLLVCHQHREALREGEEKVFTLLSDRLSRIAYNHPGWYIRFLKSQRAYLDARTTLSRNAQQSILPDLESYIELRRDASGWRMALDMVVYAGDIEVPETMMTFGDGVLGRLRDYACDIAAWAEDIVSFEKGIPGKHAPNIVMILMRERNVCLEYGLATAGMLIKQCVDAFVATEDALLSEPEVGNNAEVRRYIRGLRDWIAGFVNWLYETQLFLGDKGSEVRAFGWVFLPEPRE